MQTPSKTFSRIRYPRLHHGEYGPLLKRQDQAEAVAVEFMGGRIVASRASRYKCVNLVYLIRDLDAVVVSQTMRAVQEDGAHLFF